VYRESAQVYAGSDGIYTGSVYRTAVAKCAAFSLLWTLMCYVFVRSLHLISAVDAVALFATQSNFFFLLSWIILQRNFVALRVSRVHMLSILSFIFVALSYATRGVLKVLQLDHKEKWKCYKLRHFPDRLLIPSSHSFTASLSASSSG